MGKKAKTPGIKIRTAKNRVIRLTDRQTGKWLANVRWRRCGEIWMELPHAIRKEILKDRSSP